MRRMNGTTESSMTPSWAEAPVRHKTPIQRGSAAGAPDTSLRWHNPDQVQRVGGIGGAALSAGLSRLPQVCYTLVAVIVTRMLIRCQCDRADGRRANVAQKRLPLCCARLQASRCVMLTGMARREVHCNTERTETALSPFLRPFRSLHQVSLRDTWLRLKSSATANVLCLYL